MRLSWNEIRTRAADFAREWADAAYEKGETQSFYNEFFEIFGVRRRAVARYEEHVRRLDDTSGFIDLFWPSVLLVEQKSAGRDLAVARDQAGTYFDALPERDRPRYQLLCDFQTFELLDRDEREETRFALTDLPQHVEKFGFIIGVQRRAFRDQDPVNIEASELIARLHDALKASGYDGHDLELFLVRTVFCLFADDTGIFEPRDIFLQFLEERTASDGADLGPWLARLFQVLNTPPSQRTAKLDEDLACFPHVNGELFAESLRIPDFDAAMRQALLDAGRFDWTAISPAIFGALFQSVMEPADRRAQGAHYTTEKNILKVIEPLFLDDLRAEFARLQARRDTRRTADLQAFQARLGALRLFDPACGCGNFLIIAYRELRQLELEVLHALHPSGQLDVFAERLSVVDVDQCYGLELGAFPCRIAETALWMMDHLMNARLSLAFGQTYTRIPITASPHIRHADALETDWADVLPPDACDYVFGNPPFVGQSFQSKAQREQMRRLTNPHGRSGSPLDYVGAWFLTAAAYVQTGHARIGFVATNSVTQGEQVALLWPQLFAAGLEVAFAHRTFAWGSDARGKAHVHVVIIGLATADRVAPDRRLFSYPDLTGVPQESRHAVLSPYLFDATGLADPHLIVKECTTPMSMPRPAQMGTKPVVGQHYIFSAQERLSFLAAEPAADQYFRPFVGSKEYLHGVERFILHLGGVDPTEINSMPCVKERVVAVRSLRARSKKRATQELADYPTEYEVDTVPTTPFLVIPEVSSERREYVPIGWLEPPVIPSNKLRVLADATLADFALLTSAMHMAWLRTVTGRLKSDYMYSVGVVYNTFPTPPAAADLSKLEPLAQAVLDARAAHQDATLADLYDPDLMPPNLRRAHHALDRAVDRLYRRTRFTSERERVEHLFSLYERLQAPLTAKAAVKRRLRRRARYSR